MIRAQAAAGDGQGRPSERTVRDGARMDGGDSGRPVAFESPAQRVRRELLGEPNDDRP
jgi:hypothetical protein